MFSACWIVYVWLIIVQAMVEADLKRGDTLSQIPASLAFMPVTSTPIKVLPYSTSVFHGLLFDQGDGQCGTVYDAGLQCLYQPFGLNYSPWRSSIDGQE